MILILNPNSNSATTAMMVDIARANAPGLRIEGMTAPDGPQMITTPAQLSKAADTVSDMSRNLPPAVQGLVIGAFGDPGADILKKSLTIPVIGLAEASFEAAANLGPFAIVTTTPLLKDVIEMRIRKYGHDARYRGIFLTSGDPDRLVIDQNRLDAALLSATTRAIAAGARSVIIGGGPLAAAAERLNSACPVPLLQPVPLAVAAIAARLTHR